MADPVLVPQSSPANGSSSRSSPQKFPSSSTTSYSTPSTGSEVGVNGSDFIRESYENQGFSAEVAQFLLTSWRDSIKSQYGPPLRRWMSFCICGEIDPFHPPLNIFLQYLLSEFRSAKGRSYSSMNTIRSAISTVASINDRPAGQHPLVTRFMKAVFRERPAFPRCRITWDPKLVLDHLTSLGQNKDLSLIQLSRKLAILMLLLTGQRGQTLHLLDTRNMTVSESRVVFRIGDPLKTSRPGDHLSELSFNAYPHDEKLCVVATIVNYLSRTKSIRGEITGFFITTKPPIKLAARDTLRRWTKNIMQAAGIDLTIFSPHSTRSASSSKAALKLPLSTIISTIGWAKESTFTKHYQKPINKGGQFARAVLS